jgi:hypothetical protein
MEYSDYVEARIFVAGALSGTEKMAGSKDGDPMGWTTQQIANLANASIVGLSSVSTAGGTITLPFGSGVYQRRFVGSASFAIPKAVVLSSDTNANHFSFIFTITDVAATLTFPAGFKSGDTRYNKPTPLMWTSDETGTFKATADYDGTNWIIEFTLFPAV